MTAGLPAGFHIVADRDTKRLASQTLFGGSPAKAMRLTASGEAAWAELQKGPVCSSAAAALARRLTDAGIAHPQPPKPTSPMSITVVIPVRDRAELLDRCLSALGGAHPVIVVDDGSVDPHFVADVVARHPATLLHRSVSGGPATARNLGVGAVTSDLVAFLDSDCVPEGDWIDRLAGHLLDPLVAAVAPRIVAWTRPTPAGRFAASHGGLDLGDRPARVVPATRTSYLPTAALIARRAALLQVARDGEVFDPTLRYGEDVDLIWRLHEAGWRVRYDPSVRVRHQEPETWRGLFVRRFHYGTSAAPLARRHPAATAPLVLHPWPALTVGAALARRPSLAGIGFAASVISMRRSLQRVGLPTAHSARPMLRAAFQTHRGVGRYATQFAAPLLLAAALAPRRSGHHWLARQRMAAGSLLLGPPATTWLLHRPAMDPLRFVAAHIVDDIAYGSGVWTGCVRSRSAGAMRPLVSWHPIRVAPAALVEERRR